MKPDKPLVSVIIATKNRPVMLRRAVESVLSQSYPKVDIVVVDENEPGSKGRRDTAHVVSELRETGQIEYLDRRSPTMVCTARNEGVAASSGEVIAFLDDDDCWHETKLEKQVELLCNGGLEPALVYTGLEVVDGEGNCIKIRTPRHRGRILEQLLRENVIGTPSSVAMWRSIYEEVGGFDPVFPTRHDLDLYLRVAESYSIDFVPEALTVYLNLQKDAMSKNFENKIKGHQLVYQKFSRYYETKQDARSAYHYGTALLCMKHGRNSMARSYLQQSLFSQFTLKAVVRWLQTFVRPAKPTFEKGKR